MTEENFGIWMMQMPQPEAEGTSNLFRFLIGM
jgi:hypothetical protein